MARSSRLAPRLGKSKVGPTRSCKIRREGRITNGFLVKVKGTLRTFTRL